MKRLIVAVAAVTALAPAALAQDAKTDDPVAVLDRLALPSVAGKRYVTFNTGQSWEDREGKLRFTYAAGWLMKDAPNEVVLLTRGLVQESRKRDRTLPESWEKHRAEHPPTLPLPGEVMDVDFDRLCEELVAAGPTRYFGFEAMAHATGGGLPHHVEAVLFSHWQLEREKKESAAKLLELARKSFELVRKEARGDGGPATLEAAVAAELAANLRWQAINAANELEPREKLLARWKVIAEKLPASPLTDEARSMVSAYASLVDEDKKWVEPSNEELAKASPEKRVSVWLFRLRDHAACQMMQPGGVMVLGAWSGLPEHKVNAADELAKLGWDAIPALIESLTDARPSRCMGYWRDFAPGSFYLLTIGDCCEQIFEAVSGEPVYRRASTSGAMTKDGQAKEAQKAARAWWDKVKDKGERSFLVEAVSAGDRAGAARAERLIERFPDAAFSTLAAGIEHSKDEAVRAYFVSLVGSLEKDDVTALLEAEAAPERPLSVRIAATHGLLRRGRRAALEPMIRAWETLSDPGGRMSEQLIGLLAGSGEPAAVRALGKDLAKRPAVVREGILDSLGAGGEKMVFRSGEGGLSPGEAREPASARRREEWLAAVEEVFATALDDEEERTGMSGTWNGKSFSDPRICDIAGHQLWSRWPERYRFDISAPVLERDRQIVLLKNVWGEAHGLPALPLPPKKTIPTVDSERVNKVLDDFSHPETVARAREDLRAIGLGGLAAIESRWPSLDPGVAADLAPIVSQIACTVTGIVVPRDSVAPDEAWRARLEALRGRSLEADGFTALLVEAAKGLPEGARGFRVAAEREADGSGVQLTVHFLKTIPPASGGGFDSKGKRLPGVDSTERVTLGKVALTGSSGSGVLSHYRTPEAYTELRKALESCLASRIETPFSVRVTLAFHPGEVGSGD